MNKIELIGLIRGLVKEELQEQFKSPALRKVILRLIKEETRKEVDMLLTEMESSQPEKEVIQEREEPRQSSKLTSMVERGELPPRAGQKVINGKVQKIEKVQLVKDERLNDALNQTLLDMRMGIAVAPSQQGAGPGMLAENYGYSAEPNQDEMAPWPDLPPHARAAGMMGRMMGGNNGSAPIVDKDHPASGVSLMAMIPDKTVEGAPMAINPAALPDSVKGALTRDYRKLMKKVNQGQG